MNGNTLTFQRGYDIMKLHLEQEKRKYFFKRDGKRIKNVSNNNNKTNA